MSLKLVSRIRFQKALPRLQRGSRKGFVELGLGLLRPRPSCDNHAERADCAACVIFSFSLECGSWEKSMHQLPETVEINCRG